MHYKGRRSSYSFQLFLTFYGRPKKTVAFSQMFNHVQLHVHWVHLLNTRISRYTYITLTVQIKGSFSAPKSKEIASLIKMRSTLKVP